MAWCMTVPGIIEHASLAIYPAMRVKSRWIRRYRIDFIRSIRI